MNSKLLSVLIFKCFTFILTDLLTRDTIVEDRAGLRGRGGANLNFLKIIYWYNIY